LKKVKGAALAAPFVLNSIAYILEQLIEFSGEENATLYTNFTNGDCHYYRHLSNV